MQTAYDEIVSDSAGEARLHEREAILHTIAVMEDADRDPSSAAKRTDAVVAVTRLWTSLIADLASVQNQYPNELKARIISIGLFVLRHCEAARNDETKDFAAVIEISRMLEKGLAQ